MRTSWGEVHDLLLMHPEHGMHACLHEQRQMGIGTKAPVSYEDVTRAQFWMQPDDLGEIMSAQGSCQYLQDHAGASMEQCQEVGHGEPTPWELFARLAKILLQGGGRHWFRFLQLSLRSIF